VVSTRVGYAGGTTPDPTYHNIGNYSETVEVVYDPAQITYDQLLDVFWYGHNPTTPWFSPQYASIIFYYNDAQKQLAEASRERLQAKRGEKVYTEILPANFHPAEGYHQKYYLKAWPELAGEYLAIYPDANDFTLSTATARVNGYLAGYGTLDALQRDLSGLGLSPAGQEKLLEAAGSNLEPACPLPD
jgi:peptide-methionine (S)-S-oxide reductase